MNEKYIVDSFQLLALSDGVCTCDQARVRQGCGQQDGVPAQFGVLPVGKPVTCTINGKVLQFTIEPDDAKAIEDEARQRGKQIVVDYDHGTLSQEQSSAGNAPAAAWVGAIAYDPEQQALVAKDTNWTSKAAEHVKSGEYGYFSPVVLFDEATGRPNAIHSIALTNHPAIHGAPRLMAASDMNDADAEARFSEYETAIRDMHKGVNEASEVLDSVVVRLTDFCKGSEKLAPRAKALCDELFASDALALADSSEAMFDAQRKAKSGEQLLDWARGELSKAKPGSREAQALQQEIDRLVAFQQSRPNLWRLGLIEGGDDAESKLSTLMATQSEPQSSPEAQRTKEESDNADIVGLMAGGTATNGLPMSDAIALCDLAPMIKGMPETATRRDVLEQIAMMSDIRLACADFLTRNNATSFDEVMLKMNDMVASRDRQIADMKKDRQRLVVDGRMAQAMSDGFFTEAEAPTYRKLAEKDVALFDELLSKRKPMVNKALVPEAVVVAAADFTVDDGAARGNIPGKSYSEAERDAWVKLGMNPDYVARVREENRAKGLPD